MPPPVSTLKSIDAVTVPTVGGVLSFDTPKSEFGVQVLFTNAVSGNAIGLLEGTIDGTNFSRLADIVAGSLGSTILGFSGKPVTAVRINITEIGSQGVVTAWIAVK